MSISNASVGVVVPTLNEGKVIAANLNALQQDAGIQKIVVVDGGSADQTVAEARRCATRDPRITVLSSEPGRGRQMNHGARLLNTEWIVFHHADSTLPRGAGSLIAGLPDGVAWGGFRHEFTPSNWKLAMISRLHNWRCGRTGVIYGDQSMFVRNNLFHASGGFDEVGLEDLQFSDRALEIAPSHLLPVAVKTDSRKFRTMGEFRALAHVLSIIVRYEHQRRIGNEAFFRDYR